ncbi:hypothetical protein B9Z55_007126 [Caenorhabditis nigoni]|uniref:BTB domain-containing protein n=1 Tax=Caenorhabditis nigoni TaxID=1611254 RepID=A0A2G5V8A9_9PELO|nr:hypothetical protein B9Z55_007126 [Caenorhabditis nigoni]
MGKEFIISQIFKNVRNMKTGDEELGKNEEHFGLKWYIGIKRSEHLGVTLYAYQNGICESSPDFFADLKFTVFSKNGEILSKSENDKIFKSGITLYWNHIDFAGWNKVMDGFLDSNGNLKLEVHVKILESSGSQKSFSRELEIGREHEKEAARRTHKYFESLKINEPKKRNFEDKQFSDVALVVDEQKFYVSKLFLSAQSPYFANLFSENSGKSEIKLSNSNPQNFQFFLELLYGEPGPDGGLLYFIIYRNPQNIPEETVEGILSIADQYNTPTIIKKCEEYLLEKSTKSMKDKLEMAGKYKLDALRKSCVSRIRTVSDIRSVALKNPREMDHLILAALFQKVLTLV